MTAKECENCVNAYYTDVLDFCAAKCRDPQAAQDITHDAMTVFLEKYPTLKLINIKAWMLKTASNKVKEYLRDRKKEKGYVSIEDIQIGGLPDDMPDEETEIDESLLFDAVQRKILALLNEEEKRLFIALYIRKQSVGDVAADLGISENNARVRKSRLKKKVLSKYPYSQFMLAVILFKLFGRF